MVVGPVGSGKSAFLYTLLGEMAVKSGKFKSLKPVTAFAAQTAWIQNATIQDNILCGIPFYKPR